MINFAQEEFSEIPNMSFIQADATQLAFKNEFDLVASFFCLHWIKDKHAVLQNMVRALKNSGLPTHSKN